MLKKSQIFSFFISLAVTFTLGFFIWNIFIEPNNSILSQVLGEANQIGSKFFPASVLPPDLQQDKEEAAAPSPVVSNENQNLDIAPAESVQDQLDDIQEKLDIIQQEVNELIAEQKTNQDNQLAAAEDKDKISDDNQDQDQDNNQNDNQTEQPDETTGETAVCTGQININTASPEDLDKITQVGPATAQKIILARPFYSLNDLLRVGGIGQATLQKIIEQGCAYVESAPSGGGGGGSVSIVYPKIIISEVQSAGLSDTKEEFVELYNTSNQDVDLTGWYLQKQVGSGTINYFEKKSLLSGQKILSGGYFLIARSGYFGNLGDIFVGEALSDNTSLVLKNPNDDISDSANWTKISSGASWGRKWDIVSGTEQDFELDTPTPKAQNIAYVVPPPPADTTAPVITLTGASEVTITVGDTYTDAGATASDNVDGDITANITVVNPVDDNTAGDYTITYNVSDAAGNHAVEVTRLVHVVAVPSASNDATVTSAVYTVSPLANGAGTITNVSFGTPKAIFLSNLVFATGSIESTTSSSLSDPIASNDTLVVTAQDGTTSATYTITVNPAVTLPIITGYTFNGVAQNITVNPVINPVQINLVTNENVNWMYVRVVNVLDPTIYKTFASGVGCVDGTVSCSKTWNGGISHGATLIAGNYQIKVHIKDVTNNEFEDYITPYIITVDLTTP